MNISVTGKRIPHDHEIRDVAYKRLEDLRHYYGRGLMDAHAVLEVIGNRALAEVRVHTSDGNIFVAREADWDLWGAFDRAYDHIKRQLIKHKEMIRNHHADKTVLFGGYEEEVPSEGGTEIGEEIERTDRD